MGDTLIDSMKLKHTLKDLLLIADHEDNQITRNFQWFSPIIYKKSLPNEITIRIPSNHDHYQNESQQIKILQEAKLSDL